MKSTEACLLTSNIPNNRLRHLTFKNPIIEQSKFHFDFINDNNYYLQMKVIIERVFIMANIQKFVANNQRIFKKTLSYYIMHITVAMIVAYFVTGNLWMAVTLSLLNQPCKPSHSFSMNVFGRKKPYYRRKYSCLSPYIKRPLNSPKDHIK